MPIRALTLALALAALTATACGGGEGASDTAVANTAGAGAPAPDAGEPNARAEFGVTDLEAYERGIAREVEAVTAARQAGDTASTPESRAALWSAAEETATIPEGATASGLPEARYRDIRATVHETLKMLSFQRKIDGPMRYDTTRADAAMKARLARDVVADLPPGSAAALRARMDAIVPVWSNYVRLTSVGG